MGDEIVRVGTLEHEYMDGVIGLGLLNERDQVADQFRPQKIHRGSRDFREQNAPFFMRRDRFKSRLLCSILVIDFLQHISFSYISLAALATPAGIVVLAMHDAQCSWRTEASPAGCAPPKSVCERTGRPPTECPACQRSPTSSGVKNYELYL